MQATEGWSAYVNNPLEHAFRQQLLLELREQLKADLPEHMQPAAWMVLNALPLNVNGKLDLRALPAPSHRPDELRQYVAPRNELERMVAEIWAQVLHVDRVGAHDNFFELGGHSLLIVRMLEHLRRAGFTADTRRVFESKTLADLVRTLSEEQRSEIQIPPNLIPAHCERITPEMLPLVSLQMEHIERISAAIPGGTRNIQDIYPLTPLQEGILFHYLIDEKRGEDTYLIGMVLRIASRKRLDALIAGLQAVIDRHDSLRTAIVWEQLSQPVQVVYRSALMPVQEFTLDQNADALGQLQARLHEPQRMDLRCAPLVRLNIAENKRNGEWFAELQLHHIVDDATSWALMFAEVAAHMRGQGQSLPAPVPYRDHVAQTVARVRLQDAESFFRKKLAGIDEPTAPFGLLDVQAGDSRSDEAQSSLDVELSGRVHLQARSLGVSTATLFHAAWALVVSRTSGRDDAVFGTVLLGRMQGDAGAQQMLGLFINTLPLRLSLRDLTATALIERTQRELIDLLDHDQTPLAVAQRCSEIVGTRPLFTSLLNCVRVVDGAGNEDALAGAGVEVIGGRTRTNYPVAIAVSDDGETIRLHAHTSGNVQADRVIGYMQEALRSLVDALQWAPTALASRLSILPEQERRRLLFDFNATQTEHLDEGLVHELFERQANNTPDALAAVYEETSLSYAELNARANQLAHFLRARGVGHDTRVAICIERGVEVLVALLGVLKCGGAYVPLDPGYPRERLQYLIDDAAPEVVLTQQKLLGMLFAANARAVALDRDSSLIAAHPVTNPDRGTVERRPDQLAYVIYTSGSTGTPKGVMVEHRGVVNLWRGLEVMRQGCTSRAALNSPFSFDASVQQIVHLLSGRTLHIVPQQVRMDAALMLSFLREHRIEEIECTPPQLESWRDAGLIEDPSLSLHRVFVGGEAIPTQLWSHLSSRHRVEFVNVYGPTECSVVATAGWVKSAEPHIGGPIANTRIYILDARRQAVPIGVIGEIYIAGAGVARGYLNRAEATAERFVMDPFCSDKQERMYRTGDRGRWREDGTIEYSGRGDDQIKIRGFRIEPGEIESQLLRHERVKAAAVIAREDVPGQKYLVAYVVWQQRGEIDRDGLREHLRALLPEYMVPSAYVSLEQLPRNSNGKLDRHALPAPDAHANSSHIYEPPRGDLEEVLAGIWQELLQRDRVGRMDHFFEVGGHSLLAMQVISRMRTRLEVPLSIHALYESPTIAGLARQLRRSVNDGEFRAVLPLRKRGSQTPIFCLPPVGGLPWCYMGLVTYIHTDCPVYGLYAPEAKVRGLHAASFPDDVAHYRDVIRNIQPQGPYRLLGWSLGGLMAHALAAEFVAEGEEVELLALIDAYPHVGNALAASSEDSQVLCRVLSELRIEWPADLQQGLSVAETVQYLIDRYVVQAEDAEIIFRMVQSFERGASMASTFQPRRLNCEMLFFRASKDQRPGMEYGVEDWIPYISGPIHLSDIDSTHFSMLDAAHREHIGSRIDNWLNRNCN